MSRKVVFTKPVDGGRPAVRVEFAGKHQRDYFTLRAIAEEDFGLKQTQLARMILSEWVGFYRTAKNIKGERERMVGQLKLKFGIEAEEGKGE